MKPLGVIRGEIKGQLRAVTNNQARLEQLQAESLAHFGGMTPDQADEAVASDDRLAVLYAFAAYVGIAAGLAEEALNYLAMVKDIDAVEARRLLEELRAREQELKEDESGESPSIRQPKGST